MYLLAHGTNNVKYGRIKTHSSVITVYLVLADRGGQHAKANHRPNDR